MSETELIPRVTYGAKSTEDKHLSIPTQIEDCRRMAEREGWTVIDAPDFDVEAFAYIRWLNPTSEVEVAGLLK